MGSENHQLHIFLFPFLAHGHMIPAVDMAKLFSSRGVRTTIITTPLNSILISRSIQNTKIIGAEIDIKILKFPPPGSNLPDGCDNVDSIPSPDLVPSFFKATISLQEPLERLVDELNPNCIVADIFFPWANDVAARFHIPRLIFHGTSFFSLCASECVRIYEPHKKVESDSEPFVIPSLPHEIKLTRMQLPDFVLSEVETEMSKFLKKIWNSEAGSYGVIVNSFYELESDYADFYRNVFGRKAWHIGPLSLCNKETEQKAQRGKEAAIDEHECLKWLDSKKPNSVIYVCFGSVAKFTSSQLKEIAMGLEASEQNFIWVVRKSKSAHEEGDEDWLPENFEQRIKERGLIIRGWAPQVLILDHGAVGGFVTHCGWNSTLESVAAGVPMVTWPISAEQFYNEKFVTQVARIGVSVGTQKWVRIVGDSVKKEAVEKAVRRIMVGEEAEDIRRRARMVGEMAMKAVEEGGSSYSDLNALIQELNSFGR